MSRARLTEPVAERVMHTHARGTLPESYGEARAALALAWGLVTGMPSGDVDAPGEGAD